MNEVAMVRYRQAYPELVHVEYELLAARNAANKEES
jgi:hypothetical protein